MKVAIVGNDKLNLCIEQYLPEETHMIISAGETRLDQSAASYALDHEISLVEVMPDKNKFGDHANLVRNSKIVELADHVVAIWDGKCKDTELTIELANEMDKSVDIYKIG